ncbi:MAG: hypothetical protein GTN65_18235 [Armatimonadetes bacterium]|nr:hypothetical protein [Armatimonadota bacterium]NIO98974.1 hypothetical protein [Armatimonadota bacterium]
MTGMRAIFLPILISAIAAWLLWSLSRPFVLARSLNMEVKPLQTEKERLTEENHILAQRIKEMRTPRALEIEAHRRGWIKPGERRLVLVKPPSADKQDLPPPSEESSSLFSQMQDWAATKASEFLERN